MDSFRTEIKMIRLHLSCTESLLDGIQNVLEKDEGRGEC